MKKHPLTATSLRIMLSASMFVTIAIGIALFSFATQGLKSVATDVSHTAADAAASQNNLQNLQTIEKELAKRKDVIDRTASIVADSQSYQYQNQIITDLNDYASRAGISITNIDFSSASSSTPQTPAAPSAPATTPAAPATGGEASALPAAPAASTPSVKSTSVAITVANPVDYNNLLRFIKSIEQNLTKMQISKIGLSRSTDEKPGVTSDVLTIEVYIR